MVADGSSSGDRTLEETSTWAVAIVCTVFVVISATIEHGINSLSKWFQKREKKAMIDALEKIKAELMLLGFISLLLTVGTTYIAMICVPEKLANKWLPCDKSHIQIPEADRQQRALRRALAAGKDKYDHCTLKGKVPLISYSGIHQLHIFIFVLAVMHVVYSVLLMALGHYKMKKWKAWELETFSLEYQFTNDPARFRFAHQTSFVRQHAGFSRKPGVKWIVAFLRQFSGSISKVDYMTIRNGFINAHFAPNSKFDFHKYIKRSMEDDYKSVLGISMRLLGLSTYGIVFMRSFPLWVLAILFLFFNIYKWHTLAWFSLLPFLIILLVGTKLELVIMEMAQQIQDKTTVVRGAPVVEPSNNFFWFNRPQWILFLIHFTLFQNAYQMAYFLWKWYEFGITTCFHEKLYAILVRVLLGVGLQILCSYITFPLYSLVTQMGSHMKKSIFEEQTTKALKKWHQAAKQRKKLRDQSFTSTVDPQSLSPIHLLDNFNAPETTHSSTFSDTKLDPSTSDHTGKPKPTYSHNIDVSSVKSDPS